MLEMRNLRAAVAHVRVNGQYMGAVAWSPHRVDVTAGLRPGENVIEIELVGTSSRLHKQAIRGIMHIRQDPKGGW